MRERERESVSACVYKSKGVIKKINPLMNTVAVFAHNPGITDFVNSLKIVHLDNMPTCGVFAVKLHTTEWSEFITCKKDFWFFDYPKLEQ